MVRIIIKGVWKNTEDEVLKAAIAKYGKNQWARISSLLVRKTPKQCKARWYEWLDPSIKKTEWSKAEDEKLLHLAKLMPTQWRTIAPIVGRTATQCLERYQKLLDDAEAKENEELGLAGPGGEAGPSADDIRKLRPGEIDPDPETKPARPDPIDMDEDEKEMLSEARARLANTQGKKAKRKARERQLEEARRLAVLQKKRELKAAGIISRHRAKKKGMDYNADIPFEIKPALGFYDTAAEQAKSAAAPIGQSLRRLENKRKPEEEEAERKKRQRKNEKGEAHQTKFMPARDAQIQKLKEAEQIQKRRQLALPAAQVGDAELEEIVKIGQAGQTARALVSEGNEVTAGLLGEYEGLGHARMARTPRTAPQEDAILSEARNLRNLTQAQTPLLGEEATPLYSGVGTGFSGATPKHQVAFTPNPLATPRDASGAPNGAGMTPLRTPARDDLGINATGGGVRVVSRRGGKSSIGFESLPAPVNDFAIMVPEDEGMVANDTSAVEEDAAERDARLQREAEERKRRELARRSLPVQRALPRPVNVDSSRLERTLGETNTGRDAMARATRLIQDEMVRLLAHDSIAFPLPGTIHPGRTVSQYEMPEDDAIAVAKAKIDDELATRLGYPISAKERVQEGLILLVKEEEDSQESLFSWAELRHSLSYDLPQRRWVETASMTDSERVIGITKLLNDARDKMRTEADKAKKLERKLAITLGGYQSRADNFSKKVADGYNSLGGLEGDLAAFGDLAIIEGGAAPKRLESLQEEVAVLERRERGQQDRYRDLREHKDRLLQNISKLEDEQMAALESMNEV